METAYSYRRFSSKQQMKGDSLRRQVALANSYCSQNNLSLSPLTFEDLGISAFRSNNSSEDAGLGQFMLAITEGKIATPCTLLVENLDRLSRDNIDTALTQFMSIIRSDVTIITLFDNHIYRKGMDLVDYLTALISMARANEESKVKSQRIAAVWENRRTNPNTPRSKNCPFWLTVAPNKLSYDLNPNVEVVHRIFAHAKDGLGAQVIAKMLNSEGLKSPRGKAWTDATITKTLNNRAVLGEYQPKQRYDEKGNRVDRPIGLPIKDYYPSIISDEVFYEVQSAIKSRAKSKNRNASKNFLNVIKGVASCSYCGSTIRLKKQQELYYLQCSKHGTGTCNNRPISYRFLEDWIREVWLTPEYTPVSASETQETRQLKQLEAKVESINDTLKKLLVLLDDEDDEVILERIQEKKAEKREIVSEIESLKEALAPYNVSKEALWKRFTIVKTAFMQGMDDEVLKARCSLSQLINQLKGFKIGMDANSMVSFEVVTQKGETKMYHSAIRPYYHNTKYTGRIWKEV
ncbi:TPA: recombinase family protein [Vibrio parahaemolyticus]